MLANISWFVLAFVIHGAPAILLFRPQMTSTLYGVSADGDLGLLALKPTAVEPPKKSRGRYRIKPRRAMRAAGARSIDDARTAEGATPAYRVFDDTARARRRFRRQDEARYRVKDKLTGEFTLRETDD